MNYDDRDVVVMMMTAVILIIELFCSFFVIHTTLEGY